MTGRRVVWPHDDHRKGLEWHSHMLGGSSGCSGEKHRHRRGLAETWVQPPSCRHPRRVESGRPAFWMCLTPTRSTHLPFLDSSAGLESGARTVRGTHKDGEKLSK